MAVAVTGGGTHSHSTNHSRAGPHGEAPDADGCIRRLARAEDVGIVHRVVITCAPRGLMITNHAPSTPGNDGYVLMGHGNYSLSTWAPIRTNALQRRLSGGASGRMVVASWTPPSWGSGRTLLADGPHHHRGAAGGPHRESSECLGVGSKGKSGYLDPPPLRNSPWVRVGDKFASRHGPGALGLLSLWAKK